ncbi:PREDICTED: protein LNK1-like isoform X2 [Lupinus angustifolius]|uniref:protein LNK1-like isoform X2 n=1 Tax=Lupinus angustifolius TaxID=3871 RepID=UPI00092F76A1|nr:PREDICTED: protein LNK1-like isoform X2 [Lupinus angustifolius]
MKRLTSNDTRMSDQCFKSSNIDCCGTELCADDMILGDKCAVEDDSTCQYPINQTSQDDNELSFLDIDGWLDIGDFEDVDMMPSCDLNFGTGSLNNEEQFSWLSSLHGAQGSDDALKSDFTFSCAEMSPLKGIPDYNMDSKENIGGLPFNDSNKKASSVDKKVSCQMDVDCNGDSAPFLMVKQSDKKSGNTVVVVPKEKLQSKLQIPSPGSQKIGYLENGDSVYPYTPEKYADAKQPYEVSSGEVTSLDSIQKHKLNTNSDSLGCIQTQAPKMHPDYIHAPNHTSPISTLSGSRSEHGGHILAASLKESSYASSIESCHGHSLEPASLKTNVKNKNLHHRHNGHMLSRSFNNENIANQIPFHSPSSAQQIGYQFENEGHSEAHRVSLGFSPEIESSTVQESSSMSSALDQTSVQATNFCQLQQVMDQLDIRTKLCIRDSLYRLAKSAEQRLDNSSINGCIGDAFRCNGFMDIEADTNPIDRSVAHLLFHRPSDSSMLLPYTSTPFKTNGTTHGSVINPPVKTEKQVCQEDSSTGVGKKS